MEEQIRLFNPIPTTTTHHAMLVAALVGSLYFTTPTYSYADNQDAAEAAADAAVVQTSQEDVLDNTINMDRTPSAKTATQKNGEIVLNDSAPAPTKPQPMRAQIPMKKMPLAIPHQQDNLQWANSVLPPELFRLISQPYWQHTFQIFHEFPESNTMLE
jgi:hypothetical protein